jgi:predicted MFS family arabinose efflux permease
MGKELCQSSGALSPSGAEQKDQIEPDPDPAFEISNARKFALLVAFSLGQFVDSLNSTALFPGIPTIAEDLGFSTNETVWLISAYQLTFAAFLLLVCMRFACCLNRY